jgi:hypothetical protein
MIIRNKYQVNCLIKENDNLIIFGDKKCSISNKKKIMLFLEMHWEDLKLTKVFYILLRKLSIYLILQENLKKFVKKIL